MLSWYGRSHLAEQQTITLCPWKWAGLWYQNWRIRHCFHPASSQQAWKRPASLYIILMRTHSMRKWSLCSNSYNFNNRARTWCQVKITSCPICLGLRGFPRWGAVSANVGTFLGKPRQTGQPVYKSSALLLKGTAVRWPGPPSCVNNMRLANG